ncbi:MAG: carbohydrate kinase [Rhodopirellula sp.]|nr:carbohydrate kinase [Rhodopirellula sp.]
MTQDTNVKKTIVGLGEILWDIFPDAAKFGGAPANFACSAAGLKTIPAEVYMLSAVGNDAFGQQAIQSLLSHNVCINAIQQNAKATGRVNVTIDQQGIASYEFAADTAWDNLKWSDDCARLAAKADAVCWGTLGQRSQASQNVIQKFVSATPPQCLRVLDINLRSPFWSKSLLQHSLPMANVLKCNEDELPVLSETFDMNGDDHSILLQLQQRFSLKMIALTRGAQDSILVQECGKIQQTETSQIPSIPTQIVDTVGAGDCFTAAIVLGMLNNMKLTDLHSWACQASAYVCSQPGATPRIPVKLHQR